MWYPSHCNTIEFISTFNQNSTIPEPDPNYRYLPKNWQLTAEGNKQLILYNVSKHNQEVDYSDLEKLEQYIISTKNTLESINLERGYVLSINIFGSDYPIINEIAENFISYKE
jgi:hypothetical protein